MERPGPPEEGSIRQPVSACDPINIMHPFLVGLDESTGPVRSSVHPAAMARPLIAFSLPKRGCLKISLVPVEESPSESVSFVDRIVEPSRLNRGDYLC
jgi:hypothetical protein